MLSVFMPTLMSSKKLVKTTSYLFIVCCSLALLSYFFWDQDLALFFRREDNTHIWLMAREITDIGLGQHYFIFVFLGLLYFYLIAPRFLPKSSEKIFWYKAWMWNFFVCLLTSGFFLRTFKFIFGRQRPNNSLDSNPDNFQFFNHHWDFQSFPSGHSQVLFTVATMICVLDPKRWYLWYFIAFSFSFTRVMTYSHFLSDVIGGAFIGIAGSFLGLYLMNRYSRFKVYNS